MIATLPRLRKKAQTVELNARELALLEDIMFRAVVNCMLELNAYTRDNQNGTPFQRETAEDLNYLRTIQSKIEHAKKQLS